MNSLTKLLSKVLERRYSKGYGLTVFIQKAHDWSLDGVTERDVHFTVQSLPTAIDFFFIIPKPTREIPKHLSLLWEKSWQDPYVKVMLGMKWEVGSVNEDRFLPWMRMEVKEES